MISCHATPNMGSVRHSHELRTRALGLCLQHRIWKAAIIGAVFKWWSVLLLKRFLVAIPMGMEILITIAKIKELLIKNFYFHSFVL